MNEFYLSDDIDQILNRLVGVAQEFSGKTILLTGGRGFLGRYFVQVFTRMNEKFLQKPAKLIILDNLITAGKGGKITPNSDLFEFIKHDVTKPIEFNESIDYIIHAAGIASPFYYRAYPLETLEVAITGTRRMLELAMIKNAKITFFSSSEIYGDPDPVHVPMAESYNGNVSPQGPRACYDEGKRVGETLCYIFNTNSGVATNTIRPFNVFGPGMQESDYRVLPNFASRIKAGSPLNIYGNGQQTRTFCYITDAIVGFLLVILKGVSGETYNIGNPFPELSMLDLVKNINKVLGITVDYNLIEYPDSYPGDEPMRRSPDIRKARTQLNFQPEVDIEEGLAKFFSWTNISYTGRQ